MSVSLVGDFKSRIAVNLVKRTFLKQKNAKIIQKLYFNLQKLYAQEEVLKFIKNAKPYIKQV